MNNINSKIKTGVLWTAIDFISKAGLKLLLQIILAKLLLPQDFGIIGMALVFTVVIQALVDFGMGAALIQMKEENLTENYLSTAFWSGLIFNLIIYIIIILIIGPLIASFYEEPLLIQLFPVLSATIILNSFNLVQLVRLTRIMDFKTLAIINFVSNSIAFLISIATALYGFGVWSIAINTPLVSLLALPLYIYFNRWLPKFHWNKIEFQKIFSFGVFTSATQLTNAVTSQIDYLLIGKMIDTKQLGLYSISFQITNLLKGSIVAIVSKVMYPVYSKLQDDRGRVRWFYGQIIKFNMLLIAPIMVGLILFSDFIVLDFFGKKWEGAIPIIKILSFASLIQVLGSSNTSLIRGIGFPKLEFNIQIVKTLIVYIPSIVIGTYYFGIIGTAYSILFNATISILIAMHYMNKLTGFTYVDLLTNIYKPISVISISVLIIFISRYFYIEGYINVLFYILIILFGIYLTHQLEISKIIKLK